MQIQTHLLDPMAITIRVIIMVFGIGLGITLLVMKKKHSRLGILQIVLSICTPLFMSVYCYWEKWRGLSASTDYEILASELKLVQYGVLIPLFPILLYIALIATSTLSAKTIVDTFRGKRIKK